MLVKFGEVKVVPEPTKFPPVNASYQLIIPEDATVEIVPVPAPQIVVSETLVIVGIV